MPALPIRPLTIALCAALATAAGATAPARAAWTEVGTADRDATFRPFFRADGSTDVIWSRYPHTGVTFRRVSAAGAAGPEVPIIDGSHTRATPRLGNPGANPSTARAGVLIEGAPTDPVAAVLNGVAAQPGDTSNPLLMTTAMTAGPDGMGWTRSSALGHVQGVGYAAFAGGELLLSGLNDGAIVGNPARAPEAVRADTGVSCRMLRPAKLVVDATGRVFALIVSTTLSNNSSGAFGKERADCPWTVGVQQIDPTTAAPVGPLLKMPRVPGLSARREDCLSASGGIAAGAGGLYVVTTHTPRQHLVGGSVQHGRSSGRMVVWHVGASRVKLLKTSRYLVCSSDVALTADGHGGLVALADGADHLVVARSADGSSWKVGLSSVPSALHRRLPEASQLPLQRIDAGPGGGRIGIAAAWSPHGFGPSASVWATRIGG
jgi:hypothetical protein